MDTHVALRALVLDRLIPATPEAVFAAWVEPEKVKAWFGPYNMTVPVAEIDARPGGIHRTVMRDADGKEYPNPLEILEIEAPRRLVLRVPEGGSCPVPGAIGTLTFTDAGNGLTRFVAHWDHPTEEMRAKHEEMGFWRGWNETVDKLSAHASAPPAGASCGMSSPPTQEHGWLHRMLGEWEYEHEGTMPDGSTMKSRGKEHVHALGPYWVVGQGEGEMPGGGMARWQATMGFDSTAKRFRGNWVGSMMGHHFIYDGAVPEDGRTLVLENDGPAFDGNGMARYRDIVTLLDDGTRQLASEVRGPDGNWIRFMSGTFRRVK